MISTVHEGRQLRGSRYADNPKLGQAVPLVHLSRQKSVHALVRSTPDKRGKLIADPNRQERPHVAIAWPCVAGLPAFERIEAGGCSRSSSVDIAPE